MFSSSHQRVKEANSSLEHLVHERMVAQTTMNHYEARRLENIKRNATLIEDLGILHSKTETNTVQRPAKRQKLESDARPSRTSARIASKPVPTPSYIEREISRSRETSIGASFRGSSKASSKSRPAESKKLQRNSEPQISKSIAPAGIDALRKSWSTWKVTATAPSRDVNSVFHFAQHPTFLPNKSPEEMLREGCFGGSYFRPLYSKTLGITVAGDWQELPSKWTSGLDVKRFLTCPDYDPDVNKYKVKCGQSIEEWEAAGWIDHQHDVRGWFQWYCRFFMGRRCEDDERQISRWARCVGANGRWRLALLRKYVQLGVRDVFDDGEEGEDAPEVSPVIHQTCHQWAFEVRQDVLDAFWRNPKPMSSRS